MESIKKYIQPNARIISTLVLCIVFIASFLLIILSPLIAENLAIKSIDYFGATHAIIRYTSLEVISMNIASTFRTIGLMLFVLSLYLFYFLFLKAS